MENEKKTKKKLLIIMTVSIAVLVMTYLVIRMYSWKMSEKNYTFSGEETNENVAVNIVPREAEKWTKDIEVDGKNLYYTGTSVDVNITNQSIYIIKDWSLKIYISEESYINKAWTGEYEVHQFRGEEEKIILVGLSALSRDELEENGIDVIYSGEDILIHLLPGDYMIYHPNTNNYEYPIDGYDYNGMEYKTINTGMIMYYQTDTFVDAENYTMEYHIDVDYHDMGIFVIVKVLFLIWCVCAAGEIIFAVGMEVSQRYMQQRSLIVEQALSVFINFVDAKDPYTQGHSKRVAVYSEMIAKKLGKSEAEAKEIYFIALMHDVGKVAIPDAILKKPGRLTEAEFAEIKTHTTKGAEMLENFTALNGIREGALYHHERYDGKGYPTGKSGKDIPLIGRIICVADSFDAMNTKRCYREKLSKNVIIRELMENRGKQFDPEIVDKFLELIRDEEIIIQ